MHLTVAAGVLLTFLAITTTCSANVLLIGINLTLSFEDREANFASFVTQSGVCGTVQVTEPFDACSPPVNKSMSGEDTSTQFALIKRGNCTFDLKVRNAQAAGFRAAIIYNNEGGDHLIEMGGISGGITIHAVFISKESGQMLLKYSGNKDIECCIIPSREDTAWTVILIAFVSLLALSAVLAICVCLRSYRLRHRRRRPPRHIMSSREVKALPSLIFTSVVDDNCTSETCAVCLEDYTAGEKLRVLPCCHKFHVLCIDSWLTRWRTFCPVCKRDIKASIRQPPASEHTPLLSSSPLISSYVSSFQGSPNEHISSTSVPSYAFSSFHSVILNTPQSVSSLPFLEGNPINIRNVSRHSSLHSLYSHQNSSHIPGSFISSYATFSMSSVQNTSMQNASSFNRTLYISSSSDSSTSISPLTSHITLPDN